MPDLDLRAALSTPLAPEDDQAFTAAVARAVRRERLARTVRRFAGVAAIAAVAAVVLGPALMVAERLMTRAAGGLGYVPYAALALMAAVLLREALTSWEGR